MRKLGFLFLLLLLPGIAHSDFIRFYPPSGVTELTSNGTSITSTVPILLPDGTAAAPSLAFANATGTGMRWGTGAAGPIVFGLNGANAVALSSDANPYNIYIYGTKGLSFNGQTILTYDAAHTLAQRVGTAAQAFNVYNTFTDASNYERLEVKFLSNEAYIATAQAGTGVARTLRIGNTNNGFWEIIGATLTLSPSASDAFSFGGPSKLVKEAHFSRSIQGSKTKALTESSATAAWDCALAAGAHTGGTLNYCVYAADATDFQERCATIRVAAVNKAATTTCGITTVTGNTTVNETTDANAVALSTGTLTYAVTCADTTDSFSISFNAVSSLTQTTLQSESRWDIMTPATCTPQ